AAEERSNEPGASSPLEDMTRIALSRGTFLARPFAKKGKEHEEPFAEKPSRFSASYDGFDVHCGVGIAANDDEGRERLLRYCARLPFATDRIEVLKDGRVAYLMKTARRRREGADGPPSGRRLLTTAQHRGVSTGTACTSSPRALRARGRGSQTTCELIGHRALVRR